MDGKPYWMLSRQKNNSGQNWCFWAVVLDKTLKSPLDSKAIQPVHPKGNKSWIFSGKTGAEAETPILWPPDAKSWLIWEDPDAGKDWRQEEKGTTEDEMVGWHHRLNGLEFGEALGDGEGQGCLLCCSPRGCMSQTRLSDWTMTTERHKEESRPPVMKESVIACFLADL